VRPHQIHLVGNTMIDSLARITASMPKTPVQDEYIVLTLHRPSNVDDPASLQTLLEAIERGSGTRRVLFPVHPRTERVLQSTGLYERFASNPSWQLMPPAGYSEFVALVRDAHAVVTDSGGIQEETTWLGVPCVTLRETTERPSTVELGTNDLVGVDPEMVERAIKRACESPRDPHHTVPPLWDGHAAERIARTVVQYLQQ
jgi:UDP-N-acetylglucosamine 2-epimerase (non-hydrolysing)